MVPSTCSRRQQWSLLLAAAGIGFVAVGAVSCSLGRDELDAFRISVVDDAVYRVSYEDLSLAGLKRRPASASLVLTQGGDSVPIWVEDGGDGRFGAGDHFEFVGAHLAGETTYFDPHSRHNVYRLRFDGTAAQDDVAQRMTPASTVAPNESTPNASKPARHDSISVDETWVDEIGVTEIGVDEHLEQDELRVRFSDRMDPKPDDWYWARLSHIDPQPFVLNLDLADVWLEDAALEGSESAEGAAPLPVSLRLGLRGWSHPMRRHGEPDLPDHRVEVAVNGEPVGVGEWDGQEAYVIEIPSLPGAARWAEQNQLSLRIPRRQPSAEADPWIDVVLLDWIQVSYPRRETFAPGATRVRFATGASETVELLTTSSEPVVIYGAEGSRIATRPAAANGLWSHRFVTPRADLEAFVVASGALQTPATIEADYPSEWRSAKHRADYLMITHPTLRQAIEPLARFHRQRGLEVEIVDVVDVYDEFHHGVAHPTAIRDFVKHAHENWQEPSPRFVLLVGDASWDFRETPDDRRYADWTYRPGERNFVKNASSPYTDGQLAHRDLVPTWQFETFEGPAASDNYFVAIEGDDLKPELAIGRFPVTQPEEVAAIVDKTIRYFGLPRNQTSDNASDETAWQRNVLWITDESAAFQRRSDDLAADLVERGFNADKIYPVSSEPTNEQHQLKLRQAFDQGQVLVHFLGHGGRYIWRTGPPDYRKNHDLFTLEDLDLLQPTSKLPVVLSMTCYSAPFDHPTADSIGEKFLRLPDRGAVAVFAASWRNSPQAPFNRGLVEELTRPGGTLGEAILRAKQGRYPDLLLATYNLLGDPALELALPADITLTNEHADDAQRDLRGPAAAPAAGG